MEKELTYVRHAKRPKNSETVGSRGLKQAQKRAAQGAYGKDFTDFFHGPIFRTSQTLLAITLAIGCQGKIHKPIMEIGTEEIFDEMYTEEEEKFEETDEAKHLIDIEILCRVHSLEMIKKWTALAAKGVKTMFDLMKGNHGLACGHEPIIPFAALGFGHMPISLNELDCVVFKQKKPGKKGIIVVEYVHHWK